MLSLPQFDTDARLPGQKLFQTFHIFAAHIIRKRLAQDRQQHAPLHRSGQAAQCVSVISSLRFGFPFCFVSDGLQIRLFFRKQRSRRGKMPDDLRLKALHQGQKLPSHAISCIRRVGVGRIGAVPLAAFPQKCEQFFVCFTEKRPYDASAYRQHPA